MLLIPYAQRSIISDISPELIETVMRRHLTPAPIFGDRGESNTFTGEFTREGFTIRSIKNGANSGPTVIIEGIVTYKTIDLTFRLSYIEAIVITAVLIFCGWALFNAATKHSVINPWLIVFPLFIYILLMWCFIDDMHRGMDFLNNILSICKKKAKREGSL